MPGGFESFLRIFFFFFFFFCPTGPISGNAFDAKRKEKKRDGLKQKKYARDFSCRLFVEARGA